MKFTVVPTQLSPPEGPGDAAKGGGEQRKNRSRKYGLYRDRLADRKERKIEE